MTSCKLQHARWKAENVIKSMQRLRRRLVRVNAACNVSVYTPNKKPKHKKRHWAGERERVRVVLCEKKLIYHLLSILSAFTFHCLSLSLWLHILTQRRRLTRRRRRRRSLFFLLSLSFSSQVSSLLLSFSFYF